MNFSGPQKSGKKYWWFLAVAVVLLAAGLFVYFNQAAKNTVSEYETIPAVRGELTTSVGATGTVRARQSATLVWQTSGRVETVSAAIGDAVQAEMVLANLAESSVSQAILLAKVELVAAEQNLDGLVSSNLNLAQAQQNLASAKQAVEDAQDKYDTLARTRVSQELIDQTADEIEAAQDQLKFVTWIYNRFYDYDGMDPDRPAKAEMTIQLTNIEQNLNNLIARYNWYTSKASELDLEKAMAALNLAKAKMDDAQRELDRYVDGKIADDIVAAEARVAAAQATLNYSKIIIPFDGVITQLDAQPGDMVSAGTVAVQVEDLTGLFVDLQVSEVDINSVAVGQPVEVVFDAIQGKIYNGVVADINLVGDVTQGAVTFPVTVELIDFDAEVKPGMTAAVTVMVKDLKDVLLVENRAVRVENGQRVVYVLRNDVALPVEVRLGATDGLYSEVVGGGLNEGDQVVLNPPAPNLAP